MRIETRYNRDGEITDLVVDSVHINDPVFIPIGLLDEKIPIEWVNRIFELYIEIYEYNRGIDLRNESKEK